jgi:uncharacterized coiled-coil protein SlyX
MFFTTLNTTIAKMVDDAVTARLAQTVTTPAGDVENNVLELTRRCDTLEEKVAETKDNVQDIHETLVATADKVEQLEENLEKISTLEDHDVEAIIDGYDFSQIIKDNVDLEELLESPDFADAVRDVIVNAIQGR